MTDTAISVQGLGKHYIIGHKKEGDFRHAIGNKLKNIFKPDASEKEVFWALKDINFEIKHGEAVGIIGRNGAGKSTLLKILSRITDPSTGRFEINGRVSSLLEVGTGFHAELSGRENIYLNGTILGMKRAEIRQKFEEIVDFSGVEKFLDTPVKHYSSGMKVRLAFSVAAHLEPEILIVDEVLAVGDAEFQKKCLGKMDQVSKNEGRTVLFVSHNMGAVQNLCSRGILLNTGGMEIDDNIEKVVTQYLSKNKIQNFQEGIQYRTGKGDVQIIGLRFLDENDNEIDDVICGQDLKIEVTYESKFEEIHELIMGIVIKNRQDQFLTVLNNKMSNYYFKNARGKGKLICEIEKLPLMTGNHSLNLHLMVGGDSQDKIEDIKNFNVINSDFYNSGVPNSNGRQGIYINQNWKLANYGN